MTKPTKLKNRLTPQDYRVLADLAEEIVPGGNDVNGKILRGMPIILEGICIDADSVMKKRREQADSLEFETPELWQEGAAIFVEEKRLKANPIFYDYTEYGPRLNLISYGLSTEDYVEALKHLAEPATLWNRYKARAGIRISGRTCNIKGYTIGQNSNGYVEYEGKLYPACIAVFKMTEEALENAQCTAFNEWVTYIKQFEEHCRGIPKGKKFPNLEWLCNQISLDHKPNRGWGHTSAYDSPCREDPRIGYEKMIINPIYHHMSLLDRESIVIGHMAVRPVLSNGEIATPEVIAKYIS